ncbi:HGL255Cp [Eremothecium sinecaudum]|uniref:HGL255Cp n=1 Tax=Eremothecium sinecaudum TaxID=45286 RepID=A0A0X8HVC8_9SACH|nr:HGL255Cp [Eremothecium sinecaudum]AMD22085.1 HGL255Cp [Eremothecium sinecaudum]
MYEKVNHSSEVTKLLTDSDSRAADTRRRTKFTILDILRILLGLVLLLECINRVIYGQWLSPKLLFNRRKPNYDLKPSIYWSENHIEIPHIFTHDELLTYSSTAEDREDPEDRPVLMSISGKVYDVSRSPQFYGANGPYRRFTGTDCSNLFGYPVWDIVALSTEECSPDVSNLKPSQLRRVREWESFYEERYPLVGYYQAVQ